MAIVQKSKLLLTYDQYKLWNGHVLPKVNEEDIENGMITPDQKFEKWSFHTQTILNAILQEKLDPIDYDINLIKPAFQKSFINIMVHRLQRAFYNDEIINRDSQVQFSQQGGVNYSSVASSNPKSELYSFFNAEERALIESSGILTYVFTQSNIDVQNTEGNQFASGEFVPQVDLTEFQKQIILFNGNNITIAEALELLRAGKADAADIAAAILANTGISTTALSEAIFTANGKYIQYGAYRPNKGNNELAQVQDVKASEARSRQDIFLLQKKISNIEATDAFQAQQLSILTELVLLLGEENLFIPAAPIALAGNGTTATKDLKQILVPDPLNPGQDIQKYTDFSDTGKWEFEFVDEAPNPDHYGATQQFLRTQSGTLAISGSQAAVSVSNAGILTLTRTSGTLSIDTLKIVRIIFNGAGARVGDVQILADEIKQKVAKKLAQNTASGFTSFADLKAKISLGDFVNLIFADGNVITGTITDAAISTPNDPIAINGSRSLGTDSFIGRFTIASDFSISGGIKIGDIALQGQGGGSSTFKTSQSVESVSIVPNVGGEEITSFSTASLVSKTWTFTLDNEVNLPAQGIILHIEKLPAAVAQFSGSADDITITAYDTPANGAKTINPTTSLWTATLAADKITLAITYNGDLQFVASLNGNMRIRILENGLGHRIPSAPNEPGTYLMELTGDGKIDYKPAPTFKDITASYATRVWAASDIGKTIRINGIFTMYIQDAGAYMLSSSFNYTNNVVPDPANIYNQKIIWYSTFRSKTSVVSQTLMFDKSTTTWSLSEVPLPISKFEIIE